MKTMLLASFLLCLTLTTPGWAGNRSDIDKNGIDKCGREVMCYPGGAAGGEGTVRYGGAGLGPALRKCPDGSVVTLQGGVCPTAGGGNAVPPTPKKQADSKVPAPEQWLICGSDIPGGGTHWGPCDRAVPLPTYPETHGPIIFSTEPDPCLAQMREAMKAVEPWIAHNFAFLPIVTDDLTTRDQLRQWLQRQGQESFWISELWDAAKVCWKETK